MDTLLLVDGNALLYRAYHAFPKELSTPTGEPIGAVFGFTRILLTTLKSVKPTCVAVCFDLKGPTFRHLAYSEYKATRQKMPEDLAGQIERTHQIVEFLEIPIYTAETYEADDVIGTLARQAAGGEDPCQVIILTGDQDMIQLVTDKVSVLSPGMQAKGPTLYTPEKVQEKYGFSPRQMIEYKALRGDPSDNIPGVPGIGEVTATKLLQEFSDIATIYTRIEAGDTASLKPAVLEKLRTNQASALMSKDLATIRTDAPVSYDAKKCRVELAAPERLITLFRELGFKSLMRDLPGSHRMLTEAADVFSTDTEPEKEEAPHEQSESEKIDDELAPTLRKMEELGVMVDLPYMQQLETEFAADLETMKKQLFEWAGEEFNPDSPSQVGHILYEVLNIPTNGIRKGKTGYTTDASTLQDLAEEYPIAKLLLQYREAGKLQNTYIKPLPTMADSNARIHTSYAPDTATGRISSRNPNLQNIPSRSEQGRRIRKGFIASPGTLLVGADYSQMELRVAAHLSGDPAMQEAFRQGNDFHAETAARMNVDRRVAKIINFSILYGKGAFGFAKDLGITVAEAKTYIEQYFKTYSKLREYLDETLELARKQGYLETMYGRRRYLPDITSANFHLRAAAEREAVNLPIQGSQADILKVAMCAMGEKLAKRKSHLILTVHDELVVESPIEEAAEIGELLKVTMINAVTLDVPVQVNLKTGTNWAEMEEIEDLTPESASIGA
jgi:DNA polymerase I-like protein with 3'-5' exonuclease and polymerase domains/5'-3' exonuclease